MTSNDPRSRTRWSTADAGLVGGTAIAFGLLAVLLDYYGIFGLQRHRHLLDSLALEVSSGSGHVVIVAAALALGMLIGAGIATAHLLLRPLHQRWPWLRALSAPLLLVFLLALFAVHWLNVVVFDAIRAYVVLDGLDVLVRNARVIYQRMLVMSWPDRYMTAVLFEYYYPAGHIVGFSILCGGLLARPRIRAWMDRRRELTRRVSILAAALFIAAASCALLLLASRGQHQRQALCGSVTLPITLLPGCSRVLPRAEGPPAEPLFRALVEPYLRQRQRPWPSAKLRERQRSAGHPASAPHAGNVLLVVLESTSARHLGVYSGRPQATPALDALARGCTRHSHAFATSNITGRGLEAIFGGIVRPRTTVERDPRVHPIFPELLAEAGYQTAFFGAALGLQDAGRFLRSERWSRFFDSFEAKSHSMRPKPPCEDDCHMLREIDAWLVRRDRSRPFLLVFAPYSTHFAYKTPDTWPIQFIRRRMQFYSPLFFPREELETVREYHANAVRYVDFAVGELLRKLAAHGERGRTLVLVTADHGEDLYLRSEPSHGTSLFDSQVHVPLLVCPPGQGAAVREENVSHLDIAPTILSWAGVSPFAAYEGVDLLGRPAPPRALLLVNDFLVRGNAVILGRHKYTRDITRRSETLHDRRADPLEHVNLAEREPGLVRAMRWILQDWLDRSPF